ncbi:tripartite tricarboxylate transporter substrate-binding protein, partial [Pseudomonas viridiflava]|uniref:tripartite tricarboxylate transporter substrate-binding protein n=1 Tax=Pseudomonas viridiflava TaxID=33069 RepID=UPI0023F61A00
MKPFTLPALALALAIGAAPAAAQTHPSQPIKLIVGYAPGGSVDAFARLVAPKLGQELGQTIVIENIAGAGGIIGVTRAVHAKPDG